MCVLVNIHFLSRAEVGEQKKEAVVRLTVNTLELLTGNKTETVFQGILSHLYFFKMNNYITIKHLSFDTF